VPCVWDYLTNTIKVLKNPEVSIHRRIQFVSLGKRGCGFLPISKSGVIDIVTIGLRRMIYEENFRWVKRQIGK